MQEAMWRSHVAGGSVGADVEQLIVTFNEAPDCQRFREAWLGVIARTPVLRTRFQWDRDAEPKQVVEPDVELPWQMLDWSTQTPELQEQQWQSLLTEDRRLGFDLRHAPLLRLIWILFSSGESRLVWTFHHILLDGRSIPMVMEDVFATYESLRAGRPAVGPDRPGFDRLVRWQREWWSTHQGPAEIFWRAYLQDIREPTLLPADGGGVPVRRAGQAKISFELAPEDGVRLNQTAASLGVTPNTFVQAAWGLLLRRHGGPAAVVFGAVRAGRGGTIPEAAQVPGLFIVSQPVKFDFPESAGVTETLRAMRARQLALRDYEHTPMEQVARWSKLPAGVPLYESVVVFDRETVAEQIAARCGAPGRKFELLEQPDVPLLLSATGGERIRGHLVYNCERFPAAMMRRLVAQFTHLLRELPLCADGPLAEVSLLPPDQRRDLLESGRGPQANERRGRLLHEWFEAQADLRPASLAIQTPETATTYAELEARANQLAHHLRSLGAGPDRLIAICLPRGAQLVTAILGVLKSGAAYLPLDPATPPQRLGLKLQTARPLAVVSDAGIKIEDPPAGTFRVDLDTARYQLEAGSSLRPAGIAVPENLAYAIFTSGTTGSPKLV